jgi:anti-sigma regulatory factor (Ser/Thr protein kinase)
VSRSQPTPAHAVPVLTDLQERSQLRDLPGQPRCLRGFRLWARAFPGTALDVRAARRFVAELLDGSPFGDDAVTILSELFTNAVVHTASGLPGGMVVVQVSSWRQGVRIAVTDQGSHAQPVIRDPAADPRPAENGRGLYLAASLASQLDLYDDPSGRTVSAILGTSSPGSMTVAWPGGPTR